MTAALVSEILATQPAAPPAVLKVPRRLNDIRKRGPRRYANGHWFKRPSAWDTVTTETQRRLLLAHLAATTPSARTVEPERASIGRPYASAAAMLLVAILMFMALR